MTQFFFFFLLKKIKIKIDKFSPFHTDRFSFVGLFSSTLPLYKNYLSPIVFLFCFDCVDVDRHRLHVAPFQSCTNHVCTTLNFRHHHHHRHHHDPKLDISRRIHNILNPYHFFLSFFVFALIWSHHHHHHHVAKSLSLVEKSHLATARLLLSSIPYTIIASASWH